MRVNANNFTIKDIKKVAEIVKEYNSKLYVCTNIIMKDKDINLMKKQLPIIKEAGADGVILSDLGLIHSVVEMI